ncbi:hypothetical protein QAD02_004512 [Eretmocerus hayati]|uniref:Uncharacterized protein n=1 Tax=Eretmocerus hayati TaxID=131215 RepID=A0ACC2NPY1_9HYME|nr:hypothetical protein QAD02_004512 [Eretmocerus hayati]
MISHVDIKPFYCKTCGAGFETKWNLDFHAERAHPDQKSFTCSICDRKFGKKCHLMLHIKIHSRQDTYSCRLCRSKFRNRKDLLKHFKTHNDWSFLLCELCGEKFTDQYNLEQHLKLHSNQERLTCKICNKVLGNDDDLNNHMETHSTKTPHLFDFESEYCSDANGMRTPEDQRYFSGTESESQIDHNVEHRWNSVIDSHPWSQRIAILELMSQCGESFTTEELNQGDTISPSNTQVLPSHTAGSLPTNDGVCSCHQSCGTVDENTCLIEQLLDPCQETSECNEMNGSGLDGTPDDQLLSVLSDPIGSTSTSNGVMELMFDNNLNVEQSSAMSYGIPMQSHEMSDSRQMLTQDGRMAFEAISCYEDENDADIILQFVDGVTRSQEELQNLRYDIDIESDQFYDSNL